MLQPDVGSTVVIALASLIIMILGGAQIRQLSYIVLAVIPFALYVVFAQSYRIQRFTAFLNPWGDVQNSSYQLVQSLFAFAHGSWTGVGFGRSIEKLGFLPEPYNDFIFPVIGEEFGFIGCVVFLALYMTFILRGIRNALMCPDLFGNLLGMGIVSFIAVQALLNLGGVTGSIPETGIPLPLISYGGSSLFFCMCSIGILLSISRANNFEEKNIKEKKFQVSNREKSVKEQYIKRVGR